LAGIGAPFTMTGSTLPLRSSLHRRQMTARASTISWVAHGRIGHQEGRGACFHLQAQAVPGSGQRGNAVKADETRAAGAEDAHPSSLGEDSD
jgi:hypothetical protein